MLSTISFIVNQFNGLDLKKELFLKFYALNGNSQEQILKAKFLAPMCQESKFTEEDKFWKKHLIRRRNYRR